MPIPEETVPSSIASAASPAHGETTTDSGLRCPVCEYNLTGVAEDRCPECGNAFDRGQLLAILAGAPAPIPIWDDRSRNIVWRFAYMCLLAWFMPIRLSRLLPRNHSVSSARRFRLPVLAICAVIGWGVAAADIGPLRAVAAVAMCGIPCLVGIVLTELLLAATFDGVTTASVPASPPVNHTSFEWWQGLLGFFRSFVLLELLFFALVALAGLLGWRFINPLPLLAIPMAWWWINVYAVLLSRPGSRVGKASLIVLSPFFLGTACVIALVVGLVMGMILAPILGF